MANQPEVATFDAGVLQLETTDPVQGGLGGVSNAPLLNLANRTAYLKQHVDGLEAGTTIPPTVAPLNSPIFTGDPKAPTPALGDNDTSIPTTAFVQTTVNGILSKSVAGGANVTLTAVEAGNGILKFTGALTGNIAVIVPATAKALIASNQTTGAYSLTVKTAAGTGIVVAQGKNQELWCDGTNVLLSTNDFTDTALVGVPTAPTPAQFDNSLNLATTAFLQRALGNLSNDVVVATNTTLTAANAGNLIVGGTSGSFAVTLPLAAAVPAGAVIWFFNSNVGTMTVQRQGSDVLDGTGGATSIQLKQSDTLVMESIGGGTWRAIGGSAQLGSAAVFGASLAGSGYQKLPSGIIVQWGGGTVTSANVFQNFVLPTAFISSGYSIAMNFQNSGSASTFSYFNSYFPDSSSINISSPIASSFNYIVIGK